MFLIQDEQFLSVASSPFYSASGKIKSKQLQVLTGGDTEPFKVKYIFFF